MEDVPVEKFMNLELKELREKVKAISYDKKNPLPTNERDRMVTLLAMHKNDYPIKNLDEAYLKKHTKKPLNIRSRYTSQKQSSLFSGLVKDVLLYIIKKHLTLVDWIRLGSTCRYFYYLLEHSFGIKYRRFLNNDMFTSREGKPYYFENNRSKYNFMLTIKHPLIDEVMALTPKGKDQKLIEEKDLVRVHNAIRKTGSLANMEIFLSASRDFRKYYIQALYKRFLKFMDRLSSTEYRLFCDDLMIEDKRQVRFSIMENTGKKSVQFYSKKGRLLADLVFGSDVFSQGNIFDNNLYDSKQSISGEKAFQELMRRHKGKLFWVSDGGEKVLVKKLELPGSEPPQKKLKV